MNLLLTLVSLLQWGAIDFNQSVVLQQNLSLEALPGQRAVVLKKGTRLTVKDIVPLDQIRVLSHVLEVTPCPSELKNAKSDMTIINGVYGVELAAGCRVSTFVELQDLNTNSPFSVYEKR